MALTRMGCQDFGNLSRNFGGGASDTKLRTKGITVLLSCKKIRRKGGGQHLCQMFSVLHFACFSESKCIMRNFSSYHPHVIQSLQSHRVTFSIFDRNPAYLPKFRGGRNNFFLSHLWSDHNIFGINVNFKTIVGRDFFVWSDLNSQKNFSSQKWCDWSLFFSKTEIT